MRPRLGHALHAVVGQEVHQPQVLCTWPLRAVAINLAQLGVVLLAGVTWERWLGARSLFHLSAHVPTLAAGFIAYFAGTFVFYWWHRWRHESDLLWRVFHQIHHSAQRIEVVTSFYKHPAEMIVNSIIGSVPCYSLLGLTLEAGAVFTACCALGWFFQRPEMHRIHHQYAHHRNNYGDIVWWDMLFGTYENPAAFSGKCGFDAATGQRLAAMLAWQDVHAGDAGSSS